MMTSNMEVCKMMSALSTANASAIDNVWYVSKLWTILLVMRKNKAGARPIVPHPSGHEVRADCIVPSVGESPSSDEGWDNHPQGVKCDNEATQVPELLC